MKNKMVRTAHAQRRKIPSLGTPRGGTRKKEPWEGRLQTARDDYSYDTKERANVASVHHEEKR